MNLLDSSGWLEYFGNDENAEVFAPLVRDSDSLIVPTISMFEVFKRVVYQRDEEEALKAIGLMSLGIVVDLDREIALSAAIISLDIKLPMADSIIIATARAHHATLWTQDEHFEGLEGVNYIQKHR